MVGTQADIVGPLALERGELRGHLDDVRGLPYFIYTPR
jgi:hypothetical protein